MAQTPVPYMLGGDTLWLYPVRQCDHIKFNTWLQYQYAQSFKQKLDIVPPEDRAVMIDYILEVVANFDYETDEGQKFMRTSISALIEYAHILLRGAVTKLYLQDILFKDNTITETSLQTFDEMRLAVFRPLPPDPPQPHTNQKRREYTDDEAAIRIYRSLGEKYDWTYQQCLELTPYQVFWYLYLMPEEREQIEELQRLAIQNQSKFSEPPVPQGAIHFNSPEEYEAWLARQNTKLA